MTIRMKLHEAIVFATERHAGQKRKGTDIDYICHPLEVAQILGEMRPGDDDLIIAGVLHDLVEDGRATGEEILRRFGPKAANLVAAHTHSKEGTWMEQKQRALLEIENAGSEVRLLVLADLTSNLRSMYADHQALGEALWDRFNAGRTDQCNYYSDALDLMEDFQYDERALYAYWEATELFKDIFVKYYIDAKAGVIWQVCEASAWVFSKETLDWEYSDEPVCPDAVEESGTMAETMEDHWKAAAGQANEAGGTAGLN